MHHYLAGCQAYLECTIFPVNVGKVLPVASTYSIEGLWVIMEVELNIIVLGLTAQCSSWFESCVFYDGLILCFLLITVGPVIFVLFIFCNGFASFVSFVLFHVAYV